LHDFQKAGVEVSYLDGIDRAGKPLVGAEYTTVDTGRTGSPVVTNQYSCGPSPHLSIFHPKTSL
jgi:hypothetical protein